jgi:ethanolamine utilization protein EutA
VLDWYLNLLEAAADGDRAAFEPPVARLHEQVPFRPPPSLGRVVVTVSGGVGELVYAHMDGKPWPPPTYFGDLGIDLAQRLVTAPHWSADLRTYRPASAGRATVHGLLRHNTEISGSTLFLPQPQTLPLHDLPVLGTLSGDLAEEDLDDFLNRVQRSPRGGCLTVTLATGGAESVRTLGRRLAAALRRVSFPADRPLVLLVRENLGKVLGHYATEWGGLPVNLVVIDEVPARDARFARVGCPRQQVVPVSFYGLNEPGEKP